MLRGNGDVLDVAGDYPFEERGLFDQPAYPKMFFVEHRYANDPTNWWIPNDACAQAMLRSAGFEITARPAPEVLICRVRPFAPGEENPPLSVELAPARSGLSGGRQA